LCRVTRRPFQVYNFAIFKLIGIMLKLLRHLTASETADNSKSSIKR
jgi:hypothetical protein